MFVVWQTSLEDTHHKALFSACVVWRFFGVGFCVRKRAICSWDPSGMSGQFRLSVPSVPAWRGCRTSQCYTSHSPANALNGTYRHSLHLQAGGLKPRECLISRRWGLESRAEDQPPASTLWAPDAQQHACWHREDIWNWECVCLVPFILTGLMK